MPEYKVEMTAYVPVTEHNEARAIQAAIGKWRRVTGLAYTDPSMRVTEIDGQPVIGRCYDCRAPIIASHPKAGAIVRCHDCYNHFISHKEMDK